MATTYKGRHQGDYQQTIKLTPDKVTKLGVARTFQNIRLFKEMTVLGKRSGRDAHEPEAEHLRSYFQVENGKSRRKEDD